MLLKSLIIPFTLKSNFGNFLALCNFKILSLNPWDGVISYDLLFDSCCAFIFDVLIKLSISTVVFSASSSVWLPEALLCFFNKSSLLNDWFDLFPLLSLSSLSFLFCLFDFGWSGNVSKYFNS